MPNSPTGMAASARPGLVLPPQGLYESCLPSERECLDRLAEIGRQGFQIVLNDGLRYSFTSEDLRNYANNAQKLGMQVILPYKYYPEWDEDPTFLIKKFPHLAKEAKCKDNKCFLKYYVSVLKGHPALWGYYIADEVHPEYYKGLKEYTDYLKSLDPDHPRLIVEEGTNDPLQVFHTFHSYMKDTSDVLGVDYYPYGYRNTFSKLTTETGEAVQKLQYWSDKLEIKNAVVLQAFAWPQYHPITKPLCLPWPVCAPFPTTEQMKAQRDQAILNANPEIILWFSYMDILQSDNPEKHWKDLVNAAFSPIPTVIVPTRTPRAQICPPKWTCEDIGSPKNEGGQTVEGDTWAIQGSGWDISSTRMSKADQLRYIWQELAGDGELSARILSQERSTASQKAGIMIRQTFDPVSPYYAMLAVPGKGIVIQYRPTFFDEPQKIATVNTRLPVYLKVVRNGSNFTAFTSHDGLKWTMVPESKRTIPTFSGKGMAGLAVTSGNENTLITANFDSIHIK